jgi:hypothetical protein
VRVRDHLALSTAGAALLRRWAGSDALGVWAGSVLIDADHYLWFCAAQRRLDPLAAVRFFNEADPPQHAATRVLHGPGAVLTLLVLGARVRRLRPVAAGVALHVALDALHDARMDAARAAALERDDFSCRACGVRGALVGTHVRRQPWLLPSYRPQNLVALCGPCHDAAHAHADAPGPARPEVSLAWT